MYSDYRLQRELPSPSTPEKTTEPKAKVPRIRFRRDEKRLVLILVVTMLLWQFLASSYFYYLAVALFIVYIAGFIQAHRMHIRWLRNLFLLFIAFSLVTPLLNSGLIQPNYSWFRFIGVFAENFAIVSFGALLLWAERYAILHRLFNRGVPQSLRSRDILTNWGRNIYDAHGKDELFWDYVVRRLEDVNAPGITWQYQDFAEKVGLLTSKTKGITRKALVVSSPDQLYFVIIGAWDFGKYLAVRRLFWMRKVKENDYRLISEDYLRDDVSLTFGSVVHGAVEDAVKDLCAELGVEQPDIREVLEAW